MQPKTGSLSPNDVTKLHLLFAQLYFYHKEPVAVWLWLAHIHSVSVEMWWLFFVCLFVFSLYFFFFFRFSSPSLGKSSIRFCYTSKHLGGGGGGVQLQKPLTE